MLAALRDPEGLLAPYLNRPALEELLARQVSGGEDVTDRIWRLFITGRRARWQDGMLAGAPVPAPQ